MGGGAVLKGPGENTTVRLGWHLSATERLTCTVGQ